jgi:hypothetical protein
LSAALDIPSHDVPPRITWLAHGISLKDTA